MVGILHRPLRVEATDPEAGIPAMPGAPAWSMPLTDLVPPIPLNRGAMASPPFNAALTPEVPIDATVLSEVTFLTGIDTNGSLAGDAASFWGTGAGTAHKWGSTAAGSAGGDVTYYFDVASSFTATEKATFVKCFALWSAIANISFTEVAADAGAVRLQRGALGSGDYEFTDYTYGNGATVGHSNTAVINIATDTLGFDLGGNPNTPVGGYGLSSVVHEMGHLLGLGHGGDYNGSVIPETQQFSQFDERMWTIMSYIYWGSGSSKFGDAYPVTGTNWGRTDDSFDRQVPHTWMPLDILAAQQLYGPAVGGPLSGGQVFGFETNIAGPLKDFFDFSYNRNPVVTLYDSGRDNTLNLSGYSAPAVLDLRDGHYSSFNGMTNNLAIVFGTVIETGIGGSGDDTLQGNTYDNLLAGGSGNDVIDGGDGRDIAAYAVASSAASWTRTDTGYTVTADGFGTDTLVNVEVLRFTDRDLDPSIIHPEVYRFFNTQAGGHFFTTSQAERDSVIAQLPQYEFEGVGFYGADAAEANTAPVWRFFNTQAGGHFFTTSLAERDSVIAQLPQYEYEGIGYYAGTTAQGAVEPVWRFFNTQAGGHFFTTNLAERDGVMAQLPQYHFEGIGFYVPLNRNGAAEPALTGGASREANLHVAAAGLPGEDTIAESYIW